MDRKHLQLVKREVKPTHIGHKLDRAIQMIAMGATGVAYRGVNRLLGQASHRAPEQVLDLEMDAADEQFQRMNFTFAVIALGARVACANEALSAEKYLAFRENFPLKGEMCVKIRKLFLLACEDTTPLSHYANHITSMFPDAPKLYADLLEKLTRIAIADGEMTSQERQLLEEITSLLGLRMSVFHEIRGRYKKLDSPYQILGISPRTNARDAKKQYHALMRRYHPDQFAMEELSPELEMLLKAKTTSINEAYRHIVKLQKW